MKKAGFLRGDVRCGPLAAEQEESCAEQARTKQYQRRWLWNLWRRRHFKRAAVVGAARVGEAQADLCRPADVGAIQISERSKAHKAQVRAGA